MTAEQYADVSNTALMFASIVYFLAFLSHAFSWSGAVGRSAGAVGRPVKVSAAAATVVAGIEPAADPPLGDWPDSPEARDLEGRTDRYERIGVALTVVAAGLHLVATSARAAEAGRVPWGNMYEFTLTGTLSVVLVYLALLRRHRLAWLGVVVTAFQVVVLMLAGLFLYQSSGPLVPSLDSYWLMIHVTAAIVATGAFTLGAMASAALLVRERLDRLGGAGRADPGSRLSRIPDTASLDRLAYRMHAVGFPIWTFAALVTGPIWAEKAWGSYWNWDPKEVWAFITWVVYAAYLHARATAGWKGRAASAIALVGFATLLFNFVGINFFFGAGSQHSYAR